MKLKLTQKGFDFFKSLKKEQGVTSSYDFVFLYNCMDDPCHVVAKQSGIYPKTFLCGPKGCNINYHHHYNCNFGDQIVVDDAHYENSPSLQYFVNQGFLDQNNT